MEYWIAGVAIWGVCGFLAYGLILADNQRRVPSLAEKDRDADRKYAFKASIAGPLSLVLAVYVCRHGFMWRLPPKEPK